MHGKILKVVSNDLYGNATDKKVVVFVCFNHLKYMNKYIMFTYMDEYDKNILYYGSIYEKGKTIVIFKVRKEEEGYINKFREDYLNDIVNDKEYQILDISMMEGVEIVSFTEIEYDKLSLLDKKSIQRLNNIEAEENNNKKPVFLYVLLVILIVLLGGITYLYFTDDGSSNDKKLVCSIDKYDNTVMVNYKEQRNILYNKKNKIVSITINDKYIFDDVDKYNEFKDNKKEQEYFKKDGTFKYDDNLLMLMISYKGDSVIDNIGEMKSYLESEGYSCKE
mgnify:FL=1